MNAFHHSVIAARDTALHLAAVTGRNHIVVDTQALPSSTAQMRFYVTSTPLFDLHPDCVPMWTCTPNGVAS
jgi:hypothetical protein